MSHRRRIGWQMTLPEQDRKLTQIATITTEAELQGWEQQARKGGMFPGEQAAITWRRVELAKQVRT